MTLSIVAMRGWIMPTPLAMPDTTTRTGAPSAPGSSTVVVASLIFVSVVMIAPATAASPSSVAASCGASRAIPSRIFATGSRTPITPVDSASVRSVVVLSAVATALQTSA